MGSVFLKDNGQPVIAALEEKFDGSYQLILSYNKSTFCADGDDQFKALQNLRTQLEKKNIEILCNGSRKEVWPSGMARDMGGGRSAYICEIGEPVSGVTVGILESSPDITYCSVDEQIQYNQRWLKSFVKSEGSSPSSIPRKSWWSKLLGR